MANLSPMALNLIAGNTQRPPPVNSQDVPGLVHGANILTGSR